MIRVGLVGPHGIAREISENPPEGVEYHWVRPITTRLNYAINSPYSYKYCDGDSFDVIESPIFPILTNAPWVYTPADAHTFMSFRLWKLPTPKWLRSAIVRIIFEKDNLVKLIFKSEAGRGSLEDYPGLMTQKILSKTMVMYPAVRHVPESHIRFNEDRVNILFSSFFVRKGGIHVVDAFERLQKEFENIHLYVCSKEDFMCRDQALVNTYKRRIARNPAITFGWVDRDELMDTILPAMDIFVCPTYRDSYGYAIAEAMAFGIPVIATDCFAIPEIVDHGRTGFLIKVRDHPFVRALKGYEINEVPGDFHDYMSGEVYRYLRTLIANRDMRVQMGLEALKVARTRFGFENRNRIMKKIYEEASSGFRRFSV